MKKILLLSFCLISGIGMAQELFPELARVGKPSAPKPQQEVQSTSETVAQDDAVTEGEAPELDIEQIKAIVQAENPAPVPQKRVTKQAKPPKDAEAKEEEEDDQEDKGKKIQIYMADVNATITPNSNFSYCFGQIRFSNTMKRPVQALSVQITYGPYSNTYNIRNLVKDTEQAVSVTLIGEECERIMDMPQMQVKRCVVEKMSEAECIKRVEFIPLRGS